MTDLISRRRLLSGLGLAAVAALTTRMGASVVAQAQGTTEASLPPLPYGYAALEPFIDEQTMRIHHTRHHAAYVSNLNAALKEYPELQARDLSDLLFHISDVPAPIRPAVINNGGGHLNHAIFWATMGPSAGGDPAGPLAAAIARDFGDVAAFRARLAEAALGRFGSGWAWLILDRSGKLQVVSRANQDAPAMDGLEALVGVDVWEHAYYLRYQNRRADYLAAWWNVVNWEAVGMRYEHAMRLR